MTKWIIALVISGIAGLTGYSQVPYSGYPGGSRNPNQQPNYQYPYAPAPNPGNFLPNYYNRQSQPLSPYLNLMRGGNAGVNYFYGVRPGTSMGGSGPGGGWGGTPMAAGSQLSMGYIPAGSNPTQEPITMPAAGTEIPSLPSSAHPVTFGMSGRMSPGMGMGSAGRPGMLGSQAPAAFNRQRIPRR